MNIIESPNAQFRDAIYSQITGLESRLNELREYAKISNDTYAYKVEHDESNERSEHGATASNKPIDHPALLTEILDISHGSLKVRLQTLQRRFCNPSCRCYCHKTQRIASPGFLERLVGKLFLGYAGLSSVFRSCTVLECRQDSSKLAKVTYRFPSWFWQRAINFEFSYTSSTGPELLLRLPYVRPAHSEWFICARMGDADGLKRLLHNGQAGRTLRSPHWYGLRESANWVLVHDVDSTFGLTALHVGVILIDLGRELMVTVGCTLPPAGCICISYSVNCW